MELTAPSVRSIGARYSPAALVRSGIGVLERWLAPLADLAVRLVVGAAFFQSGLTKVQSWDTTLALFENEYSVPVLPPEVAAYAGTFTELFFPLLLVLGLGGRLAAAVLFIFNIIAVISYADLSPAGIMQHQYWGLLLLVILFHGPGRLSIDHLMRRHFLGRE
jgi:putative oxidoreductase